MEFESSLKNIGKVGVLTGGDSAEKEVSLSTAKSIEKALENLNINHCIIQAEGDFLKKLAKKQVDVVFIAMHGGNGENGSIQGMLDVMGIPYTGSGVLPSALCMNKVFSKKIFEYHGIKTPEWQVIGNIEEIELDLPLVVKPVAGGSTIATSIVRISEQLEEAFFAAREASFKYNNELSGVIVEKYIPGREITVGILDGKALPVLEIKSMTEFYDYKSKYETGMSEHYPPKNMAPSLYRDIQNSAEKAFMSTGCSGMARVDYRVDNEDYYVLEINTIPGMTETSLLPEAAEYAGIDFNSLVVKILESATKKIKMA